ncbi:MAG: hypothetical protein Q8N48_00325, partial [Thiobacillus sp.]|nr:hypothetical protein [Thiobacillus sp.]MDP2977257.1 hypothetical protein [Thiobacillus sp.]
SVISSLGGRFLSGFGTCYFNSCGIPVWGIQVSSFGCAGLEGFAGATTYGGVAAMHRPASRPGAD